jgi:hypothetical protein
MTVSVVAQTRLRSLAAHLARVLLDLSLPPMKRAQGRPGAGRHPRSAAPKAHARQTAQQHTGVAEHTAFPARWSDGLCRALPGAELSSGLPRLCELMMPSARLGSRTSSKRLDRSNDGQDHTVLPYARSPEAAGSSGRVHTPEECWRDELHSAARPHAGFELTGTTRPARPHLVPTLPRPPQPGPRFERLANRPSSWAGLFRLMPQFRISVKWNIFAEWG